jgi:hypothetical protein
MFNFKSTIMIYGKNSFWSQSLKKNVRQITKREARKLYENNVEIFLQSSNMRLDNFWQYPMPLKKENARWDGENFDTICNAFEYYNCDSERGKYIHFFVAAD